LIFIKRIKGHEYPLSKGDIVVCITKDFSEFTFGKQYILYSDSSSLLPITSDLGNRHLPAYYSPDEYYFLPLSVWRELKINKILE
jgi:urease accessory protein UreE